MARPKGSKNVRRKERKERRLAEMRKMPINALIPPLEPEEGLVCMGDRCVCHRLDMGYKGMKSKCNTKKEGGECDAMF
jgi:hypothetical protein